FVAVLGASSYTYAEATWSQGSHDWIASHERAFEFFEGVSSLLIPDYVSRNIIVVERTRCAGVSELGRARVGRHSTRSPTYMPAAGLRDSLPGAPHVVMRAFGGLLSRG